MTTVIDVLTAARAGALFASSLSTDHQHTTAQVSAAIRGAVRAHGGTRGCAGEVAAAYGQYPETAAARMRWALDVVQRLQQHFAVTRRATTNRAASKPLLTWLPALQIGAHRAYQQERP